MGYSRQDIRIFHLIGGFRNSGIIACERSVIGILYGRTISLPINDVPAQHISSCKKQGFYQEPWAEMTIPLICTRFRGNEAGSSPEYLMGTVGVRSGDDLQYIHPRQEE
jgi:hypothetical protein